MSFEKSNLRIFTLLRDTAAQQLANAEVGPSANANPSSNPLLKQHDRRQLGWPIPHTAPIDEDLATVGGSSAASKNLGYAAKDALPLLRQQLLEAGTSGRGPRHPELEAAITSCLLYTSPSPRDATLSRMPSSA